MAGVNTSDYNQGVPLNNEGPVVSVRGGSLIRAPLGAGTPVSVQGGVPVYARDLQSGYAGIYGVRALAALQRSGGNNPAQNGYFSPTQQVRRTPQPFAGSGFTGVEALAPLIMGIANTPNDWGSLPEVIGEMEVYGVPIAKEYSKKIGNETHWLLLHTFGPGEVDISNVKVDGVSIDALPGVLSQIKPGASGDTPQTIFTRDVEPLLMQEPLLVNVYVQKTAPQAATTLIAHINFPGGLYKKGWTTEQIPNPNAHIPGHPATISVPKYTQQPLTVAVVVEYRLTGSADPWVVAGTISATDTDVGEVPRTLEWAVALGQYDVRLKRTTALITDADAEDDCFWTELDAVRNEAPLATVKALDGSTIYISQLALQLKASERLQGTIQRVSATAKRKLKQWDGAAWAAPAITSSPAWAIAYFLTTPTQSEHKAYSDLDGASFLAAADWCTEKGYTYCRIIEQATDVNEYIKEACAAGRLLLVRNNAGKWALKIDKEQTTVVQQFSPINSSDHVSSTNQTKKLHGVSATFVNKAAFYRQDRRLVLADGYTAETAQNIPIIDLPGVTTADQAWKLARFKIAEAALRPTVYQFRTGIANLRCTRHDLIALSCDLWKMGFGEGLISAVNTNGSGDVTSISLHNVHTLVSSQSYQVRVMLEDGTSFTRALVPINGEVQTLTFAVPIPAATNPKPQKDDHVFIELLDAPHLMLVHSIEYTADLHAIIRCVDYAPAIYTADTGAVPAYVPQIDLRRELQEVIDPPVLQSIVSDEAVGRRMSDGSLQARIQIKLLAPPGNVAYWQYQYKRQFSEQWSSLASAAVANGAIYIAEVEELSRYDIQVRNVSAHNIPSGWLTILGHLVIGKATPPPDVPFFKNTGNVAFWLYDPTVGITIPPDFAGFQIRFHRGDNTNWDSATIVTPLTVGNLIDLSGLPRGIMSLGIKAVDTSGNLSLNPTWIRTFFAEPVEEEVVTTKSAAPVFAGTKTDCTVSGNDLVADVTNDLFWGSDDSQSFWGADDTELFWNDSWKAMSYADSITPDFSLGTEPFSISMLNKDLTIEAEQHWVEYRGDGDSLLWVPDDEALLWDPDDNVLLWDPLGSFTTWPGKIPGNFEKIELRIRCAASTLVRGKISKMNINIDAPAVVEEVNDFTVAAGGARLPLTKTFRRVKTVVPGIQQDTFLFPNARTAEFLDKSPVGPTVAVYDGSHNSVAGLVDAYVKGY